MTFRKKLVQHVQEGRIPKRYGDILEQFYSSFETALADRPKAMNTITPLFTTFADLVAEQCQNPYPFEPFHQKIRSPFDYSKFGLEMIRPLIDFKLSSIKHPENADKIEEQLANGDNVIFLANHQTETDPQILSLLFESTHPRLADEMIFVAGERVLTDPLAIPFSMGCNLLCIYSKKHIDYPPEQKSKKQLHNQKTMRMMSQLLAEGGKCIYVAPSGGRDRPDKQGIVHVAPFDPDSIEMFRLMAQHSGKKTHFYPMALATYDLLPPPDTRQRELGEARQTKHSAVHISIAPECSLELTEALKAMDKLERRRHLCDQIYAAVVRDYQSLTANGEP